MTRIFVLSTNIKLKHQVPKVVVMIPWLDSSEIRLERFVSSKEAWRGNLTRSNHVNTRKHIGQTIIVLCLRYRISGNLHQSAQRYIKLHLSAQICIKLHQYAISWTKPQSASSYTSLQQATPTCTYLHQPAPSCIKLNYSAPRCDYLHQTAQR